MSKQMSKAKQIKGKLREQLKERMNESGSRSTSGSGILQGRDLSLFMPKEGDKCLIDIIPYIAGACSPLDSQGDPKNPEGELAYVLEFYQHSGVGADGSGKILCAKTFNKRCPICEHRAKLMASEDTDPELLKQLKPSLRCAYNITNCLSEPEKVMIWQVSRYYSEENFQELAQKVRRAGQSSNIDTRTYYMDACEGKSIGFTQKGKKDMFKLAGLRFEDRDYEIHDEVLENTYCLEDLLTNPLPKNDDGTINWDELYRKQYEFFWGTPLDPIGEDDKSKKSDEPDYVVEQNNKSDFDSTADSEYEDESFESVNDNEVSNKMTLADVDWTSLDKQGMLSMCARFDEVFGDKMEDMKDMVEDDLFFYIQGVVDDIQPTDN